MQQLGQHLSAGSTLVVYDCFGAGEYLSTGDERHTPARFVLQVVNELALQCATPLLVRPHDSDDDLWRHLRRTLDQAASALQDNARLVILVDAADNAIVAANRRGDRGFVAPLSRLSLPSHVTVVLVVRTARRHLLDMTSPLVRLKGFEADASAVHLRRYYPDANEAQASEFHSRTAGNPRMQFYVLDRGVSEGWTLTTLLDRSQLTPRRLFDDLVATALQAGGGGPDSIEPLARLVVLTRPIRVDTLAAVLGGTQEGALAFADALVPGVTIEGEAVAFRDEDFEAYVSERVSDDERERAHSHVADVFLARHRHDGAAAGAVAEHLFHARRHRDLVDLALEVPVPEAVPEGFGRVEAQRTRVRRAIQSAVALQDRSAVIKLVILAAASASTGSTLRSLVRAHPELAARHAEPGMVAREHMTNDDEQWLGPAHLRAAVVLARDPETRAEAGSHLDSAEAWLRRWTNGSKSDTAHWSIEDRDIGRGAEAAYWLSGPEAARDWLSGWRPMSTVFAATIELASALAPRTSPTDLRMQLEAAEVPATWQAPFLVALSYAGHDIAKDWFSSAVDAMLAEEVPPGTLAWRADFCEVVAPYVDHTSLRQLLDKWAPTIPEHDRHYEDAASSGVAALRLQALGAALDDSPIEIADVLPPSLAKPATGYDSNEGSRRRFTERVAPLLAICAERARAIVGIHDQPALRSLIDNEIRERTQASSHRWFRSSKGFATWAYFAADAALVGELDPQVIDDVTSAADRLVGDAPRVWLNVARLFIRRSADSSVVRKLCDKAATAVENGRYSGADRLDVLADAADVAESVSAELGGELFRRAMAAAAGMNDDAARLLDVDVALAERTAGQANATTRRRLATALAEAVEATEQHVTDTDVLPYGSTLGAMSALDPPVGFAIAARWDDEDRHPLAAALPIVVDRAVASRFLNVNDGIDLLHLTSRPLEHVRKALRLLEHVHPGVDRQPLINKTVAALWLWVRRYAPAAEQPELARRILDWAADRGSLPASIRSNLQAIVELSRPDPYADVGHRITENRDPAAVALLEEAPRRDWRGLPEDVQTLVDARVLDSSLYSFVTAVAGAADPIDRTDVLTVVLELIPRPGVITEGMLKVIRDLATAWSHAPRVRGWIDEHLGGLVEDCLPDIAWQRRPGSALSDICDLAGNGATAFAVLADATAGRLAALPSWQLYVLAAGLGDLVEPQDAEDALTWSLAGLGISGSEAVESMPQTAEATVAALLWSTFGHPARSMRWRAAHATRALLQRPNSVLAESLVDKLDSQDAGPSRSTDLVFYWMSARAALLLALQRVADENPRLLEPYVSRLAEIASDPRFPHAQIRELARQTGLSVLKHIPDAVDRKVADQLHFANSPAACSTEPARFERNERHQPDGARYHFDPVDTLPYWYSPLARVFDLDVDEIARRAERWVVDEWGRSRDDWMQDVRELRDERSYERMSHRHGHIPSEESLHLYLEYHAMHMAAGELVDAGVPVHRSYIDETRDPWPDWFDAHLPMSSEWWLSDLIGDVPAVPRYFGDVPPIENWQERSVDDFSAVLGLDGDLRLPDPVLVSSSITVSAAGGTAHDRVTSALVSPATSHALLRALQSAQDPNDYRLPFEGEDDFTIDHGDLQLRGWITSQTVEERGFDGFDPYASGIRYDVELPGLLFRASHRATLSGTGGRELRGPNGELLAWISRWADPDADRYEVRSDGQQTFVRRDALLRFLADTGMDLIIEVRLDRQIERRSGSDTFDRGLRLLYLADADGTVRKLR